MKTYEQLIAEQAAPPPPWDAPPVAQQYYWDARETLRKRVNLARMAVDNLSEVNPEIERLNKQTDVLIKTRESLSDELVALSGASDRVSTARIHALKASIRCIDGRLDFRNEGFATNLPLLEKVGEAGYPPTADNPLGAFLGSLPTIERRLADLQKRRENAERDLENALRDPVAP